MFCFMSSALLSGFFFSRKFFVAVNFLRLSNTYAFLAIRSLDKSSAMLSYP